ALDRSAPVRMSSTTRDRQYLNPWLSAWSARISRPSSMGIPADSMVESWRVNTSSSPFLTEAFLATGFCPVRANILSPPPVFLMSIGVRRRRRRSATTSLCEPACMVPLTVLPELSFAWYLNVVVIVPLAGRSIGHRRAFDFFDAGDPARRVEQPAAAQGQHPLLQRLFLDVGGIRPLDDHALDRLRHAHGLEEREAALVSRVATRAADRPEALEVRLGEVLLGVAGPQVHLGIEPLLDLARGAQLARQTLGADQD